MQQVADIGLPPDRHPPEVVAALAAHPAGLAPRSALSPVLVRARVSARRAPQGQPGPGGCRLHAHARRDSRGATRGCSARRPAAPAAPGQVFLVPSCPGRGGPPRGALAPCGSRTHLAPLLQRPAWGCFHPLLFGAQRRRPWERDGERAELRPLEPPAPRPPPPPRAGKAAKDARCLVERPGRGLERGPHWRLRPAAAPRSPIGREQPRGAHLPPRTWGPEVAALTCAPGLGERR